MKTIITHISPDLDAVTSVWLLRRFLKEYSNAEVFFVPAGKTFNDAPADQDSQIIHVDTGLGRFDHHQTNSFTCAAALVLNYIKKETSFKEIELVALERVVDVVVLYDHFRIILYSEPDNDIYDFSIESVIEGLKSQLDDSQIIQQGAIMLDGVYQSLLYKVRAENELKKANIFKSSWGKSVAVLTDNKYTSDLAQKKGYSLVVTKSPKTGHVRIKTRPDVKKSLSSLYKRLTLKDTKASWFYHASGHMILNGSLKNPSTVPTILQINQVLAEIEKI